MQRRLKRKKKHHPMKSKAIELNTIDIEKPDIPSWVKTCDQQVWYNVDDPDLKPFSIKIPTLKKEDWFMCAGYDLPVEDQKWSNVKPTIPQKIMDIHKIVQNKYNLKSVNYSDIYEEIKDNPEEYEDEIGFIIREQQRVDKGFWFLNNGKITYIDGYHYHFLTFWSLDQEIEYRDVDRRWYILMKYASTTTESVAMQEVINQRTQKKELVPIENKTGYKMYDTGHRTILGVNQVKGRRQGASSRSLHLAYMRQIHSFESHTGIQSKDDNTAKKLFLRMIVAPWKKLAFFWRPNYSNSDSPKSEMVFEHKFRSANKDKKDKIELNSTIDFATSADPMYYDSQKLLTYINDECGKLPDNMESGLIKRIQVVSECCTLGSEYFGFIINLSTVGEFSKGGRQFFEVTKDSHFEQRNSLGRTKSGFINYFIPAYDGMAGFIDEYGQSIIDKPTKEQALYIKKDFGAKEFIQTKRDDYANSEKPEDRIKLSNYKRLYPMFWKDCFKTTATESPFDPDLLEDIHSDLLQKSAKEPLGSRGDFVWNAMKKVVEWEPNPDDGRFFVSSFPNSAMVSKYNKQNGKMTPVSDREYIASFDPYRFTKVKTKKVSMAGFSIYWNYDPELHGTGYEDNESANNFVCTYLARPRTKEQSYQDIINACIFFGCKVYPENNIDDFLEWCEKEGYEGYLQYDVGEKKAGFYASENTKQTMINDLRTWIIIHGRKCKHLDLIEQLLQCTGLETITDLDLLASAGGCMLHKRSLERDSFRDDRGNNSEDDDRTIDDWFNADDY